MTYVIALPCVDVKDRACIDECPVDCIYEGERSLYIHPDECVDCGACEPECPHGAIYEGGASWRWADATRLTGALLLPDGRTTPAAKPQDALQQDYYYVVPGKCNECVGFHEKPQCQAVCCVDAFVLDPDHRETRAQLLDRARWLQQSPDPFGPAASRPAGAPSTPGCGCGGR